MCLHISLNNSKLGDHIPSVNLVPGVSCRPDAPCFGKKCYACKGRFLFENVQKSLWGNWDFWNENPDEYMSGVSDASATARYFRWHSAGDIPSPGYFEAMVWVAEKNPETHYLAFTKQFEIVNAYLDEHDGVLPENLHVVFSYWGSEFVPDNPYNLPTAHVRFDPYRSKDPNVIPLVKTMKKLTAEFKKVVAGKLATIKRWVGLGNAEDAQKAISAKMSEQQVLIDKAMEPYNGNIPKNAFECPGFCGDCVLGEKCCFKMKRGDAVVFNEH